MTDLRVAIIMVNSTLVDSDLATGLFSWIAAAKNHLKEWAGMGAMAGLLVLVSLVGLWCICRMCFAQRRQAAMIVQAFTIIETGQFPQAWLSVMKTEAK